MKNYITFLLLFITASTFSQSNSKIQKKVLMVVSSYGKDNGHTRPGFEFEEFVDAYNVFTQNNIKVTVASPKGGSVIADKFDPKKEKNKAFLTNDNTASILTKTIATSRINPSSFQAIYIVGGKGAMFDIPYDSALQDIILNLYKRKGTVLAAVCHGPSAFVNVKHQNKYILDKVRITGFSNEEEHIFKSKWVNEFPFLLEDALIKKGASYQKGSFMLENVVISGKFITGQNPASTKASAEAVVKAFGVLPLPRTTAKQDATLEVIKKFLNSQLDQNALRKESNADSYQFKLIATYGFILIQNSKDRKESLEKGIALITFAKPYFFNENFQLLVAKKLMVLNKNSDAKKVLDELVAKNLMKKEAEVLLNEIAKF
ncbi:type 1 glutamine amidotransferase domain-containing protein [Polaribacter sp.]|uniref:type 1 glutamine amidotransferase domain-containing protein n=1 Tax=Polaribacter sp. TaxID=1920175 RepID=UPI003F6C5138